MANLNGRYVHGHCGEHGAIRTAPYNSWRGMLERCRKGGRHGYWRGIGVAAEWDPQQGGSFLRFLADVGWPPPGHSLDRFPDKAGDYRPGNVRWATAREQNLNRRWGSRRKVALDKER